MTPYQLKMRYNITTWPELDINYWAIPKVANTSMKAALMQRVGIQYGDELDIHHHSRAQYISPAQAQLNARENLAIVRHPVDRFLSMYRDAHKRPSTYGFVNPPSMHQLMAHIDETPEEKRNVHFRPQAYYLEEFPENGRVAPIEDRMLLEMLFNVQFPHLNKSPYIIIPADTNLNSWVRRVYAKDFKYYDKSTDCS